MFNGMSIGVHQKMLMYIKQMLMYTRKDCPMKFHFSTGTHTSNEFDVHQNVDSNVHQVDGLANEWLSGENKLLLEAYPVEKLLLVLQ